jgi:rubrerythrin
MQQKEAKEMMNVLRSAIQMEVEGKEFYQQASRESSNKLAKGLFQNLADEEDVHCKKCEEIYRALREGQSWPDVEPPSEKGKRIKSIFAQAIKELGTKIKVAESGLEAIKIAKDMEDKSYSFYQARSLEATHPLAKKFYQALAGEERVHFVALLDSYEYLNDPAGWFSIKEHRVPGI